MTDDDCGCRCVNCTAHDVHDCNLAACGYTKYRKKAEQANRGKRQPEPASKAVAMLGGTLRVKLQNNPKLQEWARFVEETAGLEREIRDAKRAEKMLELFGRADYRRAAVTREEVR